MPIFQTYYNKKQQVGLVGTVSRANAPYEFDDPGKAAVDLRPGEAVLYDTATNTWKLPTSAVEEKRVTHVVGFDMASVQSTLSSVPAGNNSDQEVVFTAGSMVRLLRYGYMWALAGGAFEKGAAIYFDRTTKKWLAYTATADDVSDLRRKVFTAGTESSGNGAIIEVHVTSDVQEIAPAETFTEKVQDIIGASVVAGSGVSATYDDAAGTTTIAVPAETFTENVQDIIGASVEAGSGATVAYNDTTGKTTITVP